MDIRDFVSLISRKRQTLVSVIFLFVFITFCLIFIQQPKYSSEARIMIVQEFPKGIDPYTMARSNEYLSSILAKVIPSNTIFSEVIKSGFNVDTSYLGSGTKEQIRNWQKTVSAKAIDDTGIIEIKVYNSKKNQAEAILRSINYIITEEYAKYISNDNNLKIRILDQPYTSNYPVKPNILLNLGISFVLSLITGLSFIYLFPDEKYNFRLMPKIRTNKYIGSDKTVKRVLNNKKRFNKKETKKIKSKTVEAPDRLFSNIVAGKNDSDYKSALYEEHMERHRMNQKKVSPVQVKKNANIKKKQNNNKNYNVNKSKNTENKKRYKKIVDRGNINNVI